MTVSRWQAIAAEINAAKLAEGLPAMIEVPARTIRTMPERHALALAMHVRRFPRPTLRASSDHLFERVESGSAAA